MEIDEARRSRLRDLRSQAKKLCQAEPAEFLKEPATSVRNLLSGLADELVWLEKQYASTVAAIVQMEERAAHYIDLFDLSPIALIYLDLERIILGANLFAAQMLGVSRPKLMNMPFNQFLTPSSLETFNLACGRLERAGIAQSLEMEMRREDGSTFWAGIEMTRIPTKAGGIYLIYALDVTRRKMAEKALEESERRSRSM